MRAVMAYFVVVNKNVLFPPIQRTCDNAFNKQNYSVAESLDFFMFFHNFSIFGAITGDEVTHLTTMLHGAVMIDINPSVLI